VIASIGFAGQASSLGPQRQGVSGFRGHYQTGRDPDQYNGNAQRRSAAAGVPVVR